MLQLAEFPANLFIHQLEAQNMFKFILGELRQYLLTSRLIHALIYTNTFISLECLLNRYL